MIDQIGQQGKKSKRRCCRVLGFRRQTYYSRLSGHRPEQLDQQIAELLHKTVKRFIAWGFWLIFFYLRKQGHPWNHKKVYRIWKAEQLHLRVVPRRPRIRRLYQALLAPEQVNQGWAMDFVSDWIVGPNQKAVRVINIMDESSRRALWTQAYRSISAKTLIEVLNQVIDYRRTSSLHSLRQWPGVHCSATYRLGQ
ncbi:MAG: hypothetical protein DHS20C18_41810 [Saprospiraceae bacterium]|nr:MAG: hypothetical protein DHS20C18_41810 [Saprospiraceae bacterium]